MKPSGMLVYVGTLAKGGTCLARLQTLGALGWDTRAFDIHPYQRMGSRIERSIGARFNFGRALHRMNADLLRWAESLPPAAALIWIDKGVWLFPETLEALKSRFGSPALHYTPDAQIHWQRSRYFMAAMPQYEFCVTTKEWEIPDYRAAGARRILLTLQGYGDHFDLVAPAGADPAARGADAGFIGHYQRHYRDRLRALCEGGVDLRIWGNAWHRRADSTPWLKGRTAPGLFGDSYPATLGALKIGIGLLGKHIPETSTTRSFEIPAVGTFLLAERTEVHRGLFEEGLEAEFFGSDEEMVDKARFYLANEAARERIARAGLERCRKSGYSASSLLSRLIEEL